MPPSDRRRDTAGCAFSVALVDARHEIFLGLTASELAQFVGVAIAALSAAAAWRSAHLNYRSQLASARPELSVRPLAYGDVQVHYEVDNHGGGLARNCGFFFMHGDQYVAGYLGTGTLRPGERVRVRAMRRPWEGETIGVVMCDDAERNPRGCLLPDAPK